jgi:hypothetical protein
MSKRPAAPLTPPTSADGWNESAIVRRLPDGSYINLDQWIDQRVASITKNLGGRPRSRAHELWQSHVVQYYARQLAEGGPMPNRAEVSALLRDTARDMIAGGGMVQPPTNKTVSDYAKRVLTALEADSELYG